MAKVVSIGPGRERQATPEEEAQYALDEQEFAAAQQTAGERMKQIQIEAAFPLQKFLDVLGELAGVLDAQATPKLQALAKEIQDMRDGSSPDSKASSR